MEEQNENRSQEEGQSPQTNEQTSSPENQPDSSTENIQFNEEQKGTFVDNTKDKIKETAVATKATIKHAINILTNPIPWTIAGIVGVVVFLGVTFSSQTKVFGPSNQDKYCSSVGNSSYIDETKIKDDDTKQAAIVSWFTTESIGSSKISKEQASAIVANLKFHNQLNNTYLEGTLNPALKEPNGEYSNDYVGATATSVGIMKWTGNDKIELIKKANEENKKWSDINLQLSFLSTKLNENKDLKESTFDKATNTPEESAKIIAEKVFNIKGNRVKEIQDEASKINSEHKSAENFMVNCSGAEIDTSNALKLIAQTTTKYDEYKRGVGKVNCSHWKNCGWNEAKSEYREAKKIAEQKSGKDLLEGLLASCDRFVATILKSTGIDPEFPWGATTQQYEYMLQSPKWKEVSCHDRKPGDVMITRGNGHIMIYYGKENGIEYTASASYLKRTAHKFPAKTVCNSDGSWTGDGRPVMAGFRRVEGGR